MKPGIKTTELYITIIGTVVAYLAAHGIVDTKSMDALTQALVSIYGGLVTITPAIVYIVSRTWLKSKQQPSQ